jgi:tetratricopeptide (TPR) repeat protein
VVGALVGKDEAPEQGVIGETPKRASELQADAEHGAVMIDAATRRLTGALFEYAEASGIELHDQPGPERGSRVLGESRLESRFEALRGGAAHLPLIGREEELDLLLRRWRQAQSGEGRVVLLRGEAGIGKSHLVAALQAAVAASGDAHERLDWFCSPQHQGSALHPIIARLERAAGFVRDDVPKIRLAKLQALLAYGAATTAEVALVADLLGLPGDGRQAGAGGLGAQHRRQRTLATLLRRVEVLAKKAPVLGVLEDAHWADPTTLELLDLVAAHAVALPVLLVITHRPEFRAPWAGQAHVTELGLNRLSRRDNFTLVERVAGVGALSPEVVVDIVERTDGVPLFVEELTRAMLEEGAAAIAPPAAPAVPATLHTTLNARLDRLGKDAKHAAQAGAAIGREFGYDLLAAVVDMSDQALMHALHRLEGARLVHRRGSPPEAMYNFRHALLRDAAYGMLLRAPRRALHAHIAEAIARLHTEVAEGEPQLLAWHYTRAGLTDPAIEHWRRAGVLSVARFANLEAIGHFRRALELLNGLSQGERRDRLEAELRLKQAVPLIAVHGFGSEMVEACASRAKELGERLPNWPGYFVAHRLAWNASLMRREVPKTVALGRDLLASAEGSGDAARVAVACRALGYSLFIAGEQAAAEVILERGIDAADGLADLDFAPYGEDPRVICRIYLGQVRVLMGRPASGLLIAREGLALARAGSNPHSVAWALVVLSHLNVLLHDAAEAGRIAIEANDVASQHHFPQWIALAQQWHGWALCRFGDRDQGLALLEEGLRRLRETGAVLHATTTYCLLAEGCLLAGRPGAALGHVEAAHQHAEAYGERYLLAEIHRLRAEALRASKASAQEIEEQICAALDTARRQAATLLELRAAVSLAQLWREQGRVLEARDLLATVYAALTEGFASPDLIEARALLEDLGVAQGGGVTGGASQ